MNFFGGGMPFGFGGMGGMGGMGGEPDKEVSRVYDEGAHRRAAGMRLRGARVAQHPLCVVGPLRRWRTASPLPRRCPLLHYHCL